MTNLRIDDAHLTVTGSQLDHLEAAHSLISERFNSGQRNLIAVAGPPAVGKSSLSEALVHKLNENALDTAILIPMDGFHLDNAVLERNGLLDRKGSPPTFDYDGFASLLSRLKDASVGHYVPVFDRSRDISIAGARFVPETARSIVVEGNYLLLDQDPWRNLAGMFDLSIFLKSPIDRIQTRLVARWMKHGYDLEGAQARALRNDVPNAELVMAHRLPANLICQQSS